MLLVTLSVVAVAGCLSRPRAREPEPGRVDAVASRLLVANLDSIHDSVTAAALREARERSNRAAAQVDTIVVRPDTLRLRVGQVVEPFTSLTIEGRTARGERVAHFAPLILVADRSIAQFTAAGLVGRRPGVTWLVLSPSSTDSVVAARPVRSMVWILVEP